MCYSMQKDPSCRPAPETLMASDVTLMNIILYSHILSK